MHWKKSGNIFFLKYFLEINLIYIINESNLFLKPFLKINPKCIRRNYKKLFLKVVG